MSNTLQSLKSRRGLIKGSLTRFGTYLDALGSDVNVTEIKRRMELMQRSFEDFSSIHVEIELLEQSEDHEIEYADFESKFIKTMSQADEILMQSDSVKRFEETFRYNNHSINNQQANNQIRLPKIDLPTFFGAYEEWYPFHDTFHSLIHSNPNVSDIEKFHYLKSSVKGEAASCLQSLEISSNNYSDAWSILKERYDNKRLIVQKHIKAICELPVVAKENYKELRQILDGVLKHMRALKSLSRPTEHWDDWIIHVITSKLDPTSSKEWEADLSTTVMPTFQQLTNFLGKRCRTLEAVVKTTITNSQKTTPSQRDSLRLKTTSHVITNTTQCTLCSQNHAMYQCKQFLSLSPNQRMHEVKTRKLCINCLKPNHLAAQCSSSFCKSCHRKHNTLLHQSHEGKSRTRETTQEEETQPSTTISNHSASNQLTSQVLLSTAIIEIADNNGHKHSCRALLDSGSQSNLIARSLVNRLHLVQRETNISVVGVSQSNTMVTRSVETKIKSKFSNFQTSLTCLILDKISEKIPLIPLSRSNVAIPANIRLADPNFDQPREIELLIGAELFYKLLCIGQISLGKNQPCLQKTLLGWVISGKLTTRQEACNRTICNISMSQTKLEGMLTKFWELENIPRKVHYTPDEKYCEQHFKENAQRDPQGRFIVSLHFKQDAASLGNSRGQALKRFYSLEKRLDKDPKLKGSYISFMREYLNLGHMKELQEVNDTIPHFYLPHHGVVKEKSLTTKLRVVFDGSTKSSSGVSLNDTLLVGPKIQQDLVNILIRFRTHKYVLSADIAKMYRQVVMHPNHTVFQRILWRENKQEAIKTYELTTVTYGTTPASFLAVRALQQLAQEEGHNFPIGCEIILRDFYVDDLLTGANTITQGKQIRDEVQAILIKGGFELRKWNSNAKSLLEGLDKSDDVAVLNLDKDEETHTLGLQWNTKLDMLQYSVHQTKHANKIAKRHVLSEIAKIFDPLGLVSPIIIRVKILIQRLWELKLDWDEIIPMELQCEWLKHAQNIENINQIKIPRRIIQIEDPIHFELHGFCDASEQAYGACIYLRALNKNTEISSNLICSKSRVAPLKAISTPRLELCGALVLAHLMNKVTESLILRVNKITYWTDSTIVLSWIRSSSKTWKTFVANRISEIHELTNTSDWKHVSTAENPADILSRGSTSQMLAENQFWWEGPAWLQDKEGKPLLNEEQGNDDEIPERRQVTLLAAEVNDDWFNRYSSLTRLQRITAYCLRFKNNIMARLSRPDEFQGGSLSCRELKASLTLLLKRAQHQTFRAEIQQLQASNSLSNTSKLLSLSPFVDNNGLLRVGGRLEHADIPYQQKHPIIIPRSHPLTKLIIMHEHLKFLHAGIQSTLAAVRENYWPLSGKGSVKSVLHSCIICFKSRPKVIEQIMGNLPSERVRPAKPFENVGIDYFGPIYIREGRRRNSAGIKTYGAIFVCFATKAVHLELVGNLSTDAFLAALKRFMGRRGRPSKIFSDNGTQFVGANRELMDLKNLLQSQENQSKIQRDLSKDNIEWHFIPPRAPHFGGLWESAVKFAKGHLTKVVGKTSLNFEEMSTLLIQIEAILNSRPLCPMSNDPNDLAVLTPAHFLIGGSLMSNAEPHITHLKVNQLSRWQYIQQMQQHFWTRWCKEYLSQLQTKTKWKRSTEGQELKPGALVLIKEEAVRPMNWVTGRIVEVHPGDDGVVRVATVKTSTGIFKRAAARLRLLPIN